MENNWKLLETKMPSMRINQKYFEVVINKSFLIFIEGNIDLKSVDTLEDIVKSIQYKPEENIEINNPEVKLSNTYNFRLTGNRNWSFCY